MTVLPNIFSVVVGGFRETFRPCFWLGNFRTLSQSRLFADSLQCSGANLLHCFTSIPFVTRVTIIQANYDSGTQGSFSADYFT